MRKRITKYNHKAYNIKSYEYPKLMNYIHQVEPDRIVKYKPYDTGK